MKRVAAAMREAWRELMKNEVDNVPKLPAKIVSIAQTPESDPMGKRVEEYFESGNIPVLPMRSADIVTNFMVTHEWLVNEYIYRKLKRAIMKNDPDIILFRLGDSHYLATIFEVDYEEVLDNLKAYFLKTEQYERLRECERLHVKNQQHRIIREASEM